MNHCQTRQLRNSCHLLNASFLADHIRRPHSPVTGRQHRHLHLTSYLIAQCNNPLSISLMCELFETATYAALPGQTVTYYGLGPDEEKSRHP